MKLQSTGINTPRWDCFRCSTDTVIPTCNKVFSSCFLSANFAAAWRCAGVCVSSTRTRSCSNIHITEIKTSTQQTNQQLSTYHRAVSASDSFMTLQPFLYKLTQTLLLLPGPLLNTEHKIYSEINFCARATFFLSLKNSAKYRYLTPISWKVL